MAYIRKTRGMLRLERAYGVSDIRALLLTSYARHNTIKGVAREYRVSEQTMSAWFRQLGLHTRASLPAQAIPQDLSVDSVSADSGWSGDFDDAGTPESEVAAGADGSRAADTAAKTAAKAAAEPRLDAAGNFIVDAAVKGADDGDDESDDGDDDDDDFFAVNPDDEDWDELPF